MRKSSTTDWIIATCAIAAVLCGIVYTVNHQPPHVDALTQATQVLDSLNAR